MMLEMFFSTSKCFFPQIVIPWIFKKKSIFLQSIEYRPKTRSKWVWSRLSKIYLTLVDKRTIFEIFRKIGFLVSKEQNCI